ncbi:MAG: metal ABC transporter substrate-binding protein [Bacteroidota bacterium]
MKKIIIPLLLLLQISVLAAKPKYITTGFPIYSILIELAGNVADIEYLVPGGASPHTYQPKPSDASKTQSATAFFYVSPMLDGWAANFPSNHKYCIMDILPEVFHQYFSEMEHNHSDNANHSESHKNSGQVTDPHFWTDPLTVQALLPALTETLCLLDPLNKSEYISNAQIFDKRLQLIHWQIENKLLSAKGKPVFLFHPSFLYMIHRYGLNFAGVIEIDPGVEPSSKHAYELVNNIKSTGAKVIFSEPQLPLGPAKTIAETAKVKLSLLDPSGGVPGRMNYFELLMFNVSQLEQALK